MTPETLKLRQAASIVFWLALIVLSLSFLINWLQTGEARLLRLSITGTLLFGCMAAYRVRYLGRAYLRQAAEDPLPAEERRERGRVEGRFAIAKTVVILVLISPGLLSWPLGGDPVPTLVAIPSMGGLVVAAILRRRAIAAERVALPVDSGDVKKPTS